MDCKSILVIEDDKDIRETVEYLLKNEGYDVYSAENGKEAINLMQQIPQPPLILLDMMMPVMNGWEFLEAQKAQARFANIPVVVVSAVPAPESLVANDGQVQAHGHLQKPVDLENLLKVVQTYALPVLTESAPAQNAV